MAESGEEGGNRINGGYRKMGYIKICETATGRRDETRRDEMTPGIGRGNK